MTAAEGRRRKAAEPNDRNRQQFLAVLAQTANVTAAAERAGIDRLALYRLRRADPAFARDWDAAREAGIDAIEDEAIRRACEGIEKPVIRGGETVGHVQEYSDGLLMFLLKARRPGVYGPGAKPDAASAEADPRRLSDGELAAIAAGGEAGA